MRNQEIGQSQAKLHGIFELLERLASSNGIPIQQRVSPMKSGRILGFFLTTLLNVTAVFAAVTVSVHPARAPLTLAQPQQFTATVLNTTNHNVTWAVDGVVGGNSTVGTISSSGFYRPPASRSVHKITARSVVQSTAAGSATVWVTDYPGMFTYHGDKFRSGVNFQELALFPANVNKNTFGKLFARGVDGQIYAQPLYVANLRIAGGTHNIVYVVTEHDSVYAFDADGKITAPFWQRRFINPAAGITTIAKPPQALIAPEIGITSTPVIDLSTGTIYVAASTRESGIVVHRLHALSLTTGAEQFGGPIVIQGSAPGSYPGVAVNGRVPFIPKQHLQRPALLLLNGNVYVAFGSNGDAKPYNGWIFVYSAQGGALHQVTVFCTSPDQGTSAIWASGGGLSADNQSNIYVATGNGPFDLNTGGADAGDTVLKLAMQSGALMRLDYFTPADEAQSNANDLDLGSGGTMLPPFQSGAAAPNLVIVGGKDGKLYLISRDNMGKFNSAGNQNVETLTVSQPDPTGGVFATPAVWNSSLYLGPVNSFLMMFTFSRGLLSSAPAAQSPAQFLYPGTTPMISANSNSGGIVWALQNDHYVGGTPGGAVNQPGPAILHAYDATNLHELYNSAQAGTRDQAGNAIK